MPLIALVTLLVVLGVWLPVQAQPAPIAPSWATFESVDAKLHSDDSSDVAWGAFLAAEYQFKCAIPAIAERLQTTLSESDRNRRHHLTAALLDALIQLDAREPADVLLPFYSDWPIHTLILLGSASENRDSSLVALIGGASGERWYAIADLLLETRAAGFAARLLRDLSLTLNVRVSDLNDSGVSSGFGNGASHADGIGELPAGFPPYAHYSFGGGRGAKVLALGPTPVYYTRIVRNTHQFPVWFNMGSGGGDYDRIRYLKELLKPEQVSLEATNFASVRWSNVQGFRQDVYAARRKLVEQYEQFIGALLRRQRLTEAEARILTAPITVTVVDNRLDRSVALPRID
jgi:hypothetical protein